MISLPSRLLAAALLFVSQVAILISGIWDDNVAVIFAGSSGLALAVVIGLVFISDFHEIQRQRRLNEINTETIKVVNERMKRIESRLHNQE